MSGRFQNVAQVPPRFPADDDCWVQPVLREAWALRWGPCRGDLFKCLVHGLVPSGHKKGASRAPLGLLDATSFADELGPRLSGLP